jgi:carboxymethylenebutenolidase
MAIPGAVTDLSRIHARDVTYESEGVSIEAYLAMPSTPGPSPGLVVIHEAFGLVEHIRDLARRWAQRGYIALAPNLYSALGSPDSTDFATVAPKMFALRDADVVRYVEDGAAYIRRKASSNGKVGCIGFCSGGRHTLLVACSSTEVDAAVDCWGGFILRATPDQDTTPARPARIIDLAETLHCPLFMVVGEEDSNPSPADAEAVADRMKAAGKPVELKVYHGAGHAFLADYRPTYREAAAFVLWDDANRFLDRHLRA